MKNCYLIYYCLPLTRNSKKYISSMTKIMDYINENGAKEKIIYIINLENIIYKIYDKEFSSVFMCDFNSPELLLNAVLNLLPEKIVFLTPLGKKISRVLMLLFNCIYEEK